MFLGILGPLNCRQMLMEKSVVYLCEMNFFEFCIQFWFPFCTFSCSKCFYQTSLKFWKVFEHLTFKMKAMVSNIYSMPNVHSYTICSIPFLEHANKILIMNFISIYVLNAWAKLRNSDHIKRDPFASFA